MALKRTKWRPDTCSCEVVYEWDDTVSEDTRTHTPISIVACPLHALLGTLNDKWTAVSEHNGRKNKAINAASKQGVDINAIEWSYNDDILTVHLPTLTATKRSAVQSWCDTNLGVGKVVVTV